LWSHEPKKGGGGGRGVTLIEVVEREACSCRKEKPRVSERKVKFKLLKREKSGLRRVKNKTLEGPLT